MTANEITVLINLLISSLCIWAAMYINMRFLKPALLNQKRFALYQIRDRLTLLAMRGVIGQDSEEYITLLRLINGTIQSTKSFRITRFLRVQAEIIRDKKVQEHLNSILKKIESEKMPVEYQHLVTEFFGVALQLYKRQTSFLRKTLFPLIIVIQTVHAFKRVKSVLNAQLERIDETKNGWEFNFSRFSDQSVVCPA